MVKPVLPLESNAPLKRTVKYGSASEQAQAAMQAVSTIILATVMAGGWRANWICSLVGLIITSYQQCQCLVLFAVPGGDACKAELAFIHVVLLQLGFECTEKDESHGSWEVNRSTYKKPRDGDQEMVVMLFVADHVECKALSSPPFLANMFYPREDHAASPNLRRCAVVPSPVSDKEGIPIAARLNTALGRGLKYTTVIAEKLGYIADATIPTLTDDDLIRPLGRTRLG